MEPTGEKDDEGKTVPRNARHLPHHPKGGGATGASGTVDLPHLRNALARMNQITPVTDKISAESLRSKAKSHLIAHAKKLEIGDWGEDSVNLNNEVIKMANLKVNGLDINMTVTDGEEFEANLKKVEEAINKALEFRIEQAEQEMTDVKQARDDAVDSMNEAKAQLTEVLEFEKGVRAVLGEDITTDKLKRIKQTADAYIESLVNETIKYGLLVEMIPNDKVEERKAFFMKLSIDELKIWLEQYQKIHDERNPRQPILTENSDDKNPVPSDAKPKKPVNESMDRAFTEPL